MKTALLKNAVKYGFDGVPLGIIEPSFDFNPKKSSFSMGDGRSVDVKNSDLVAIDLSEKEMRDLFPLCY